MGYTEYSTDSFISFTSTWPEINLRAAVADPGFPVGGRRPPTRMLFGENECENKRIGSHLGRGPPPGSANVLLHALACVMLS